MRTKLSLFSIMICAGLSAQTFTEQTIDLTASYAKDVYYNLPDASGEDEDAKNWHLAFGLGNGDAAIHFQDSWGNSIYRTSYTLADWSTIDTAGISSMTPLNNSQTNWAIGSLNQDPVDPSSGFDLGWGTYDMVTHYVNGSAVYIAEIDGAYYKLFINQLKTGKYTFQYEEMVSGATLVQKEIVKSDYEDRTFVHYDMEQDIIFEREPEQEDWQFIIGKYIDLAPTTYPVVGVRTRKGIEIAEVDNTDPEMVDYSSLTYQTDINTVGFDWKSFNMGSFNYDITENLSYVLKEEDGTLHHFYFTAYEGSSTGIVTLMYKTPNLNVSEIDKEQKLVIASNPIITNQPVNIQLKEVNQLNVFDQLGKLIQSESNPGSEMLLTFKQSGLYIVQAVLDHETITEKLVVQ